MNQAHYEVFIQGETVDLALPSELAIDRDGWHMWLNDVDRNKYTGYGVIPNTSEKQKKFLEALLEPESDRFALLLVPKNSIRAVGIVSLSSICFKNRSAQTALIIGGKDRSQDYAYHGFEAKARITEHAFKVMGLERISGGQVTNLRAWQQVQLLFGFKPEGICRRSYRRGFEAYDSVFSACLLSDYLKIVEKRQNYWPGKKILYQMIKQLPKENIVTALDDAIQDLHNSFFQKHNVDEIINLKKSLSDK